MELNVLQKTGFQTNDKFIRVYDDAGELFYTKDKEPEPFNKVFNFNLPRGRYTTTNNLRETAPRKYKLPLLPRRERSGVIPSLTSINVIYAQNPNKASIIRNRKLIILDYSIRNLSAPERVHIRLHELAHYIYTTEKYCDLWATREMLKLGYNPSQIFFSVMNELSNSNSALERKQYILTACENAFK